MHDIEEQIQAAGATAARVTQADIEAEIVSENYFTALQGASIALVGTDQPNPPDRLATVTICTMVTRNGTALVGHNTGPVSPENFRADIARKLARESALDQLWPMLGYTLRQRMHDQSKPAEPQ